MLRWITAAALMLSLCVATPAHARGLNNLKAGVNSIMTCWIDPIWLTVYPPDQLEDMPGYPVTGRVAGLFMGTLQGGYRLLGGATDIVTFPFWIVPLMSPPPRFPVIPDVEGYRGE
jgi:hypothetical protein